AGRTNDASRALPPGLAQFAYPAVIVGGKTLPLKERPGVGIERPDVETKQCDIPARRLRPHGADERGADAAATTGGAHADLIDVDHVVGVSPRRLVLAGDAGEDAAGRVGADLRDEDQVARIL